MTPSAAALYPLWRPFALVWNLRFSLQDQPSHPESLFRHPLTVKRQRLRRAAVPQEGGGTGCASAARYESHLGYWRWGHSRRVKRLLRYPPDLQDAAVQKVLQQAEALSSEWMTAA
jgi:hypothetical protein